MNPPTYVVQPLAAKDVTAEEISSIKARHFELLGCGVVAVVLLGIGTIAALVSASPVAVCPGGITIALIFWYYIQQRKVEEDLQRAREEKARAAQAEAMQTTQSAEQRLRTMSAAGAQVAHTLREVQQALSSAEYEYKRGAFNPFWDAIENAALQLSTIQDALTTIERARTEYTAILAHRQHTFPQVTINIDQNSLAQPVEQLRSLIRNTETNTDFTGILESRRTRHVLIAGFTSVVEAVDNIGDSVTKLAKVLSKRW